MMAQTQDHGGLSTSLDGIAPFITVAGGQYDQSPETLTRMRVATLAADQARLKETKLDLLKRQRESKREKRNWGERARQLIASLPAGGFVLFTDGGSNTNRNETGWGVTVLRKRARGHPEVVAELYGPVDTDSESDYYVGAISQTNDTAEATAAYQANLWLHNDNTHVGKLPLVNCHG